MSDAGDDSRDVECSTNLRAFHDIRAWSKAVKVHLNLIKIGHWP
ncbi:unnamed protein product [Onchocerca flexuosa]|uniref:Uncharacterized protein n=1 Tax=Onchocerca flexuosa TaxID=387005 RepID=A0A183I6E9_9BILA|nr:unnamed protein product [Onchocerca flexuosa]